MAIEDRGQTLAAFTVSDGKAARRLLENIQKVDAVDGNVEIVDAAVVDRSKRGRIVVHQTHDTGALKSGAQGVGDRRHRRRDRPGACGGGRRRCRGRCPRRRCATGSTTPASTTSS